MIFFFFTYDSILRKKKSKIVGHSLRCHNTLIWLMRVANEGLIFQHTYPYNKTERDAGFVHSHWHLDAALVHQFPASISVWILQRWRGVIICSGTDTPLEVVQSDNCTGPSLNLIKRNFPQSNVTWPNKGNVVTVTVFDNLYEKKGNRKKNTTTVVEKCLSSRPSCQLFSTFLPKKQCLSPAKNFNSPSVCDEKRNFVTFQDVWWVRISITTHYNSIHMIINCPWVEIDRGDTLSFCRCEQLIVRLKKTLEIVCS